MNRARGGRVLERQRVAEHCGLFVSTSCSINRFQVLAFPSARISKCSHDCQRAPRKPSVHAVVLCASCSPLYCPGNAHHVSQACMQSSCAHHVPHCTVQALRARGKRAVVLPHAFGLLSRSQRLWQGAGAVHRQHLSLHVDGVAPAASVDRRRQSYAAPARSVQRTQYSRRSRSTSTFSTFR